MLKRKRRHKLGTSNTDPARFNKSQIKIYGYLIPISIVMLLPIIYIREYRCHYVFKCVDICVRRVRFI